VIFIVNLDELFKLLPVMAMGSERSLMQLISTGHDFFKTSLCKKNTQDQFFFNKNNIYRQKMSGIVTENLAWLLVQ
jgi:hypothetical protein